MKRKQYFKLYISLAASLICAAAAFIPFKNVYISQMLSLASFLLIIAFLIILAKLFLPKAKEKLTERLAELAKNISYFFSRCADSLRRALGITGKRFLRGNDEHSFVFDEIGKKRRQQKRHKLSKRNINDNREKLRLMYLNYIFALIRRGYRFSPSKTPLEISDELSAKSSSAICGIYTDIRYSSPDRTVTDEELSTVAAAIEKKKDRNKHN